MSVILVTIGTKAFSQRTTRLGFSKSGRRHSNPRPSPWQRDQNPLSAACTTLKATAAERASPAIRCHPKSTGKSIGKRLNERADHHHRSGDRAAVRYRSPAARLLENEAVTVAIDDRKLPHPPRLRRHLPTP